MELRLDLHIHSERSPDGCMALAEIAERARAAGLNGVAVCDHDRVLEEVPGFPDLLLIPGVEVSTEYGHLLGLFVREPIGTRKFAEAVERIHSQGGLAVLAHPFEHSRDAGRIAPIAALLDFFGRKDSQVLEYWVDNSRFSNWTKPPQYMALNEAVMAQDVAFYKEMGFESLTSFACYLGDDYVSLHGEPPIRRYGEILRSEKQKQQ